MGISPTKRWSIFLSGNWHSVSVLLSSKWLFLGSFIGRFLSLFWEQIFYFNLEHGSACSHFKYFTSYSLVCTTHTIGSIWHLSKRLEEATSRCCIWLVLLCPHLQGVWWGMVWYSPQKEQWPSHATVVALWWHNKHLSMGLLNNVVSIAISMKRFQKGILKLVESLGIWRWSALIHTCDMTPLSYFPSWAILSSSGNEEDCNVLLQLM